MVPRVAFFTDTFDEINGVALTSRQLVDFARRNGYPLLCIRGGEKTSVTRDGSVTHLQLRRGRQAFRLDSGLLHDPLLWRFGNRVAEEIENFGADIVHVVSPGDVGEIGAWVAKRALHLPLAISWHTNIHEFGAARLRRLLERLPTALVESIGNVAEQAILKLVLAFYRLGDVLYAPNPELTTMLAAQTGKPAFLMTRGVDTELFHPDKRTVDDGILRLGYVGRITPEKSVRFFAELETALNHTRLDPAGVPPFRFLIVGEGSDRPWLQATLHAADLPGIERGAKLAESCANMDVFVFPSRSDTFGNVILEAFASGTPAVVTNSGGPRFIVREGVTGYVAASDAEFVQCTAELLRDATLRKRMALAARRQAENESWGDVFQKVYDGYGIAMAAGARHPGRVSLAAAAE